MLPSSPTVTRLLRFALVGGTVAIVFSGLNWVWGLCLGKEASFLLSYPPALGLHFCLNKRWTFGCRRTDTHRQVREYILMVLVTFVIQWGIFNLLIHWTSLPGWAAAGAANLGQMAVTFGVMQRRIFAEPSVSQTGV